MKPADTPLIAQRFLGETCAFLRSLVEINSFTENPDGVNRLGVLIAAEFASLGFESTVIQAADPRYGRHHSSHRRGHDG